MATTNQFQPINGFSAVNNGYNNDFLKNYGNYSLDNNLNLANYQKTDDSLWGQAKGLFGGNNQTVDYTGMYNGYAGLGDANKMALQNFNFTDADSFNSFANMSPEHAKFATDFTTGKFQNMNQANAAYQALQNNTANSQWTNQDTFGALSFGLGAAGSIYGLINANKQMKLAQHQADETNRLNHANYRNQAKTLNSQYRDQLSGRGYIGMSDNAKSALGREYTNRKLKEDY